ncbi:MAG TPA: mandelate racemase/muconate lactonizing enzyme family protein [Vicinamibacterales bacterium]|nr:mandelate racemase/muconate lactonizing enzyme family protein [Vicinamibacterales bacterium]
MRATVIVRAEVRLARVPVDPPRGDAIQEFDALELPIVELVDAAGRRGVGFGYTIGTGGTAIAALISDDLLPRIVGEDALNVGSLTTKLRSHVHALTPGCISSNALAAIDIALWDLAAHRAMVPLHVLLGGAKDRVRLYNTDVGWLNRGLDEMVDLSKRAVQRDGFTALKLKVGKDDADEDVERVTRVREAVGPKTTLMIDANQKWTVDQAITRAKKLERCDLYWLEEPLDATDLDGFARLGRHTNIARAGGESLYSPAAFHEVVRRGALDILQPDVARVGGIAAAIDVCRLAAAAHLPVAPHVSPELSVTVACAVPNSVFVEYIPQMEPILARPLDRRDGYAYPFDAPGHGIEFDEEALDRFTTWPKSRSSQLREHQRV